MCWCTCRHAGFVPLWPLNFCARLGSSHKVQLFDTPDAPRVHPPPLKALSCVPPRLLLCRIGIAIGDVAPLPAAAPTWGRRCRACLICSTYLVGRCSVPCSAGLHLTTCGVRHKASGFDSWGCRRGGSMAEGACCWAGRIHATTMSASGLSRRSMWRAWQWLLMLKGHAQPTACLLTSMTAGEAKRPPSKRTGASFCWHRGGGAPARVHPAAAQLLQPAKRSSIRGKGSCVPCP